MDWEGMQTAKEPGDRIGMLLDLDQGSMTVWKNGVQLGVMAEGLSGPYWCWAAEMSSAYREGCGVSSPHRCPTAFEFCRGLGLLTVQYMN